MADLLSQALVQYGLPGIIILALGYWVIRLQNKVDELQDKRFDEGMKMVEIINANTIALDGMTKSVTQISNLIVNGGRRGR